MKIQSIIRVAAGKYEVRVFIDESSDFEYQQLGITQIELEVHKGHDYSMTTLASKLLENPKVNAVEIIGWDKNGIRIER